jgi:hypothetical protein
MFVPLRKASGFGSSVMGQNALDEQTLSVAFPEAVLGGIPAAVGAATAKEDDATRAALPAGKAARPWRLAGSVTYDHVIDPRQSSNVPPDRLRLAARLTVPPARRAPLESRWLSSRSSPPVTERIRFLPFVLVLSFYRPGRSSASTAPSGRPVVPEGAVRPCVFGSVVIRREHEWTSLPPVLQITMVPNQALGPLAPTITVHFSVPDLASWKAG